MTRFRNLAIGLVVLVLLLLTMVTYRVPFDKSVVVTSFGDAAAVRNEDGQGAGLYFKWPWPIQRVAREYDRGPQALEDRLEQQNTADNRSVVLNTYVFWRIEDPLAFYRTFGTEAAATRQIRTLLRSTRGVIGRYDFDDLFNIDSQQLRRDEIEAQMKDAMQEALADNGVAVERVGIKRTVLGESVTEAVTQRQRQEQVRRAEEARSAGVAEAGSIRSRADTTASQINSFAGLRAAQLRGQAGPAIARLQQEFAQEPELARTLLAVQTIPDLFNENATVLINPDMFGSLLNPLSGELDLTAPPATRPSQADDAAGELLSQEVTP